MPTLAAVLKLLFLLLLAGTVGGWLLSTRICVFGKVWLGWPRLASLAVLASLLLALIASLR